MQDPEATMPESVHVLGEAISAQIVAGADVLQRAMTKRTVNEAIAEFSAWYLKLAKAHLALIAAAKIEAEALHAPRRKGRH